LEILFTDLVLTETVYIVYLIFEGYQRQTGGTNGGAKRFSKSIARAFMRVTANLSRGFTPGGKPKRMYWRTFERLQATHDAHVNQALAGMAAKMGLAMGRLEAIQIRLMRPQSR
jgi:hypothetical protein